MSTNGGSDRRLALGLDVVGGSELSLDPRTRIIVYHLLCLPQFLINYPTHSGIIPLNVRQRAIRIRDMPSMVSLLDP